MSTMRVSRFRSLSLCVSVSVKHSSVEGLLPPHPDGRVFTTRASPWLGFLWQCMSMSVEHSGAVGLLLQHPDGGYPRLAWVPLMVHVRICGTCWCNRAARLKIDSEADSV